MAKILVGKTTEIMPGQMKKVSVDGNEIIIINIDGDCFAIDDHVHSCRWKSFRRKT